MLAFRATNILLLLSAAMAQSNFVDNVLHEGMNPIQDEVILNSDLLADMAASPEFAYHYISTSEISIGAGYSIKLEDGEKNLYKDGIKCELSTSPESVITDITNYRGSTITSSIGTIVSENYILHMCPNKSFQFYKHLSFSDSDDDDGEGTTNSTQLGKRYGYRCINRKVGADKTCGDNPKSGNPVNSAHNCPGKGYQCNFPQGPNGDSFGTCCYSINTAWSCGFEGGYCFLDKVKNTCGNDCIN